MADQCKCSFAIRMTGDGCRYCQPQTYIDHLEIQAKDDEESMVALMVLSGRLAAQLRECADTLGADQIDEQRAMRAYADSVKLLDEMTHISRIKRRDMPLKEQE